MKFALYSMDDDPLFKFTILQPSGGGSKTLPKPALSLSYRWTASAVAGKQSRSPVYILAEDKLKVKVRLLF